MGIDIFTSSSAEERDGIKQELINLDVYTEDLNRFIMDQNYMRTIIHYLQHPTTAKVCLYMLEGFDFASRDIGSFSDPYIKVKLGPKVVSKRDDY